MKIKIENDYIKYLLYFFLFLAFSFGIATFRGSDHGVAPTFTGLNYADKSPVSPELLKNKTAVVYFWATWCGVCKANLPLVKWYASSLKNAENTLFLSIEEGADQVELAKYIQEKSVNFPIIVGNDKLLAEWKISGFPTFIFIDKHGMIRYVDSGIVNPVSFWLRIIFLKLF